MRKVFTAIVVLMWAAVLLGGAFRPQASVGATPQPQVGYPAPPFSLVDLEGKKLTLQDLKGKAVFLNFWASWCPPCRLEMPEIQRLTAKLPEGSVILTVNMTTQESSLDAVRAFLKQNGYTFPVALDLTGETGRTYKALSLPTSLFISPEGIVTARINGPLSEAAMAGYLKAAGGK